MASPESMVKAVGNELQVHGFVEAKPAFAMPGLELVHAWTRKTFNTNRAAVVVRAPTGSDLGALTNQLKLPLGKALGYFPFFYGIGLQVIWLGESVLPPAAPLDGFVDKIDNQRSIVQSVFVVDLKSGTHASARTWGQVITGKFQDAIDRGIKSALATQ